MAALRFVKRGRRTRRLDNGALSRLESLDLEAAVSRGSRDGRPR